MIPSWAPNVHPVLVHFPIVLVVLAFGVDVLQLIRPGKEWVGSAEWLYTLAALAAGAAYLSGRVAAPEVFVPGMAHALVEDHERWGLGTTAALAALAALRLVLRRGRVTRGTGFRVALAALGLGAALLTLQTAERGARLVYEHGVGVIPGSAPAAPEPPGSTN